MSWRQEAADRLDDFCGLNPQAIGVGKPIVNAATYWRNHATEERKVTKGEYRVGIDFNPSSHSGVSHIKAQAAALIDLIEEIDDKGDGEIRRLKAHAQTIIEDGAMWAVKATTKKPQE